VPAISPAEIFPEFGFPEFGAGAVLFGLFGTLVEVLVVEGQNHSTTYVCDSDEH